MNNFLNIIINIQENVKKLNNSLTEKNIILFTALPYANYYQHLGHMISTHIPADITKKLFIKFQSKKTKTLLIGGSDCHGSAIEISALKQKKTCKEVVQYFHSMNKNLFKFFNINYDIFSKTTTELHKNNTINIFKKCFKKGIIYKKQNKNLYCNIDKMFLHDRFISGICNKCCNIIKINEFCEKCKKIIYKKDIKTIICTICHNSPTFKISEDFFLNTEIFQKQIENWLKLQLIETKNQSLKKKFFFQNKKNMNKNIFQKCISRNSNWGIKISDTKTIYVWFEALIGYLTFFLENENKNIENLYDINNYKTIHFMGKDNSFFHSIIYPTILLSQNLNLPYKLKISNFLNYNKRKFSKSKNHGIFFNNINDNFIYDLNINNFNIDSFRFALIYLYPENKDINFSFEKYFNIHNNVVINNIFNIYYRLCFIIKKMLCSKNFHKQKINHINSKINEKDFNKINLYIKNILNSIQNINFSELTTNIIKITSFINKYIQKLKIWEAPEKFQTEIYQLMFFTLFMSDILDAIMPLTIKKILLNLFNIKNFNISEIINIKKFNMIWSRLLNIDTSTIKKKFFINKITKDNQYNIKKIFNK